MFTCSQQPGNLERSQFSTATVHMITWILDSSHLQASVLGRGQNAWRAIMAQRKAFNVLQFLPCAVLFQEWRHGGRQHDICKFFSQVVNKCQVTPFHGSWKARCLEAGRVDILDRGVCCWSRPVYRNLLMHGVGKQICTHYAQRLNG